MLCVTIYPGILDAGLHQCSTARNHIWPCHMQRSDRTLYDMNAYLRAPEARRLNQVMFIISDFENFQLERTSNNKTIVHVEPRHLLKTTCDSESCTPQTVPTYSRTPCTTGPTQPSNYLRSRGLQRLLTPSTVVISLEHFWSYLRWS